MKMNFREWSVILEALTNQWKEIEGSLHWCKDADGNIMEGYEENARDIQAKIDVVKGIIKKIEGATL